jgi:small neutral amino acid transporter SnatA (MarC family)
VRTSLPFKRFFKSLSLLPIITPPFVIGLAVILLLGARLSHFLGAKGITAIERLMGMVLVASAVQMFLDGVAKVGLGGG